jgi:hypothetical protein
LADLNETSVSKIDLTISDFRTSGCSWCHPGGGVLEYDREGHRFDGKPGLFSAGANPSPKAADYRIAGLVATTTSASAYCKAADCSTGTVGAGFFEVTASTASLNNPEDTINQGSLVSAYDTQTGTWKTVGKKYASAATAGAAEADCLMCHLSYQYSNIERNWGMTGATMPKLGASLGLVGTGGTTGLLNIAAKATSTANPNVAPTAWTWNESWGATSSTPGNRVMLRAAEVQSTPRNENCAMCHFPDKSMAGTAAVTGPASKPVGFTAFQKLMPAGSIRDGDEIPNAAGKDGNNDVEWKIAKGRVEGGKRGESLNDPNNRDAHMKWGSTTPAGALKMACVDCHFNIEGTFAGITDTATEPNAIVQPSVTVGIEDHQFAKGDNTPDGKNMDALDNTATCESCHIYGTHPKAYLAKSPAVAHKGFPPSHFEKIACKTCHIPSINSPMNQDLADFTVGPYRTFERTQVTEVSAGTNRKPYLMWRQAEHGQGHWQIQPFDVMAVAVVANATAASGGEATAVMPTFQRLGKRAAELLRARKGDADANGVFDWTLNAPQAGDTTLIVNKADEIADFLVEIGNAGGASAPANPVLHFYFNQFSLSHNVVPKAGNPANGAYILGSPLGGGCVMCHSDRTSSDKSVEFFNREHTLFAQPVDGGAGLVQTAIASPAFGDLERINLKYPYSNPLASGTTLPSAFAPTAVQATVNLSNAPGQTVGNRVNHGTLLGYGPEQLALLKNPDVASFTITVATTSGGTITNGAGSSVVGSTRVPGFTDVAYTLTPSAGYYLAGLVVNSVSVPVTATGMTYTFPRLASNQAVSATFKPSGYLLTVKTAGTGQGTVTTTGTDPDIACAANAGTCSGTAATGSTVTLAAQPAAGSLVASWVGCSSVSADKLTCSATMTSARTVTVTFQPSTYLLTVRTAGSTLGTVATPDTEPDISCSANTGTCSGSAANGATVTLVATPAVGSMLHSWKGCATVSADKLTCTTAMTMARTVTANFQPATYLLTVKTSGTGQGTVTTTDTDPDLACSANTGSCSGAAPNGATVTLTAQPAAGSIVSGWVGCTSVSGDTLTCTTTMVWPQTVTATFSTAVATTP